MNPIQTIRDALEILRGAVGHPDTIAAADRGLAALAELGAQQPVAWRPRMVAQVNFVSGEPCQSDIDHWRLQGYELEYAYAAPVAQQPQARPDFTDEWTGYLKDGETPFERFLRERKDLDALTKLYQRALEENERLKAQQPQAEAAPHLFDPKHMLAVFDKARHGSTGPAGFARGIVAVIAEWEAGRGQAEAVPSGYVADKSFRWDGEKQQHIPRLIIEFEPVPANSPCDAQGWRDRDQVAGMFAAAPKGQP